MLLLAGRNSMSNVENSQTSRRYNKHYILERQCKDTHNTSHRRGANHSMQNNIPRPKPSNKKSGFAAHGNLPTKTSDKPADASLEAAEENRRGKRGHAPHTVPSAALCRFHASCTVSKQVLREVT
jgi:hypothetical protein